MVGLCLSVLERNLKVWKYLRGKVLSSEGPSLTCSGTDGAELAVPWLAEPCCLKALRSGLRLLYLGLRCLGLLFESRWVWPRLAVPQLACKVQSKSADNAQGPEARVDARIAILAFWMLLKVNRQQPEWIEKESRDAESLKQAKAGPQVP
eukprot:799554-Pelagomonas_calceolata.AAC.1